MPGYWTAPGNVTTKEVVAGSLVALKVPPSP
jgi:hypothetical protein